MFYNSYSSVNFSNNNKFNESFTELEELIESTDNANKTYIDNQIEIVNGTITSTDNARKTYIDNQIEIVNGTITSTDNARKTYIDNEITTVNNTITSTDNTRKLYVDNEIDDVLDATKSFSKIKLNGNLTIGTNILTETLLGYLTPVTSSIQEQINNIDTSDLLSTNNTWTNFNTFNKHLRLNDKLFFTSNNNNFIGFTSKSTNNYKFTFSAMDEAAVGYLGNEQQLVVNSNGITVNTGSVNANSLTLGSNILSSDLLFFLNKLKDMMSYNITTTLVSFTNQLTIAGTNKDQDVVIDNGNITIEGQADNGIIIGGNKISSTIWGYLASIFTRNNTFTGNNFFNNLSSITSIGNGPYLRTQQYFINVFTVFTEQDLGINQLIILSPNSTDYSGIELPNPNSCQGQTVNILNYSGKSLEISMTGDGNFTGKNTSNTFIIGNKDTLIIQSNYFDWIILSSAEVSRGQHLQTKTYGNNYDNLFTTSIDNDNGPVTIFSRQFTPINDRSTVYVSFDCKYEVSGGNNDTINSFIVIEEGNNTFTLANKKANFGDGFFERQSNKILFPLSGINRTASPGGTYSTVKIIIDCGFSDDTVTIDQNSWNMIVTETANNLN